MPPIPPEWPQRHQKLTPTELEGLLSLPIKEDTDPFVVYCHATRTLQQEYQHLTPETIQKLIHRKYTAATLHKTVFALLLQNPNTLTSFQTHDPEQVFDLFIAYDDELQHHPFTPQDIHTLMALAAQHHKLAYCLIQVFDTYAQHQPEEALKILQDLPAPEPLVVVKLLVGAARHPEHHTAVLSLFNSWHEHGHTHAVMNALPMLHHHGALSQEDTYQLLEKHLTSENESTLHQALCALDEVSTKNLDPFFPLVQTLTEHPRWEVRLKLLDLRHAKTTVDFLPTQIRIIEGLARDVDPQKLVNVNTFNLILKELLEKSPETVRNFLVQWLEHHPEDGPDDLFKQERFGWTLLTLLDPAHLTPDFLKGLLTGPVRHARFGQRLLEESRMDHLTFSQALTADEFRVLLNRLLSSALDSLQQLKLMWSLCSQVTDETRHLHLSGFTELLMQYPGTTHRFIQDQNPKSATEQQVKDHLQDQHQQHFPVLDHRILKEFGAALDRQDLYLHHHGRWIRRIQQQAQAERGTSILNLFTTVEINRGSGIVFFREGKFEGSNMHTFQETVEFSRSRIIDPELECYKRNLRIRGEYHENRD